MRRVIHVPELPDRRDIGLSHAVETDQLVFAASMALHQTEPRRDDAAVTIADETRICLERLALRLKPAGCTLKDVVKMTCYISDRAYYQEFVRTYLDFFPADFPVRTTLTVGIGGGCRVEVDAIAVKPS